MSEDIKADVEWEAKMSGEEADPHPGSEKGDPDLDHVIMDSRIAVLDREVGRLRADIEGQESNNRSEILSGLSDLYERQIESFLVAAGCQRPVAAFPREYALGLGSIFVEANSFVNIIVQTQVIFCPGNHDEPLRAHLGADFGNVLIRDEVVHETADGRRFLVLHGDCFDSVVQCGPWLARLGSRVYGYLLALNGLVNRVRRGLGLRYWSLAGYLKHKVKNAVSYIGSFEQAVAAQARLRGVDGMLCGHIHHAEVRDVQGALYCNCGDWVESCTALVEHHDGRLELLRWTDAVPESLSGPLPALALAS